MEFPKYLSVNEAADRLCVSVSYLNKLRLTDGEGPPFLKMGSRVVYDPADLAAWAESQKQRSTRSPAAIFPDPELRAAFIEQFGESFAVSYLDQCAWNPRARTLTPKTEVARRKLSDPLVVGLFVSHAVTIVRWPGDEAPQTEGVAA